MKKIYLLIITLVLLMVGCGNSNEPKEYKLKDLYYNDVKVVVDTTDNIDLLIEDSGKYVTKDNKKIASIVFASKENYLQFINNLLDKTTVIKKDKKDDTEYVFYLTDNNYNHLFLIKDTDTAVIITANSENNSVLAFNHLTFSK